MLIQIIAFLVGIIGVGSVSYGAWLSYPPAGFIVGGMLALFWSYMVARQSSEGIATNGGE
ncbi:hypothetical protein [Aliamphritea ceti]|uniref:hypothetical protein n=1 Tax=Aliamphritea ceti TaxID=1524258 RepID=UPI0021C468E8|nr:hypothetical protein [Aliamphritea ceti]